MNSNNLKEYFLEQWVSAMALKYAVKHIVNTCAVIQALLFHL